MDSSRVKSKIENSLCEKSMMVVANVIRLSSFSIAQMTLGTGKSRKDRCCSGSDSEKEEQLERDQVLRATATAKISRSTRSQEPQSRANPTYLIHEAKPKKEECVDGLASDYITKIRNKLGCGL